MRQCTKCGVEKPLDQFEKSPRSKGGRTRQCKACRLVACNEARRRRRAAGLERTRPYDPEKAAAWRAANRDRTVQAQRKSKYGITAEQYDQMLAAQEGRCAICRDEMEVPHIDHCHETGRIRGLLCGPCNRAIGLLKDNPEAAQRAAHYLRSNRLEEAC